MVVTSPPYNIGLKYRSYEDELSREDYEKWVLEWSQELHRVLEDEGSFFLNLGSKPSDPTVPFQIALALSKVFVLQNTFHWIKAVSIDEEHVSRNLGVSSPLSVGHYKPINSERYVNDCHEYVFHFTKSGRVPLERLALGVPYADTSNIKRWKNAKNGVRCRGNNWFVPYETIQNRDKERPHPATFPKKLVQMCLELHGLEYIDSVLDPFMGIGSTMLAAESLGLKSIGFELDSYYIQVAKERLSQMDVKKKKKSESDLELAA